MTTRWRHMHTENTHKCIGWHCFLRLEWRINPTHTWLTTSRMTKRCVLFQAEIHTPVFDKFSYGIKTRKWAFVLVLHYSMSVFFEEIKNRKPNFYSFPVSPHQREVIGKCLVVHEDPWGDVEGYDHVQGVVPVGGQDSPHPTETIQPQGHV